MSNKKITVLYLIAFLAIFPAKAHAYLDPGTGSYILQVVGAVLFAGIFVVKGFWQQIKDFINHTVLRKEKSSETSNKKN